MHRRNFFAGLVAAVVAVKAGKNLFESQPDHRFDDFLVPEQPLVYPDLRYNAIYGGGPTTINKICYGWTTLPKVITFGE